MRKLASLGVLITTTWVVYNALGYQPCQPHKTLLTDQGIIIPAETCSGIDLIHNTNVAFDNILVLVTSIGILVAVASQLYYTRHYSTRGLGILCLLMLFLGTYFRSFVLPRVFGFPTITKTELSFLRAALTWGGPLFAWGTLSWQYNRIRGKRGTAGQFQLTHEPPPDL